MQLYAVNFIPLLSSLYMFRAAHTPIIRSIYIYIYIYILILVVEKLNSACCSQTSHQIHPNQFCDFRTKLLRLWITSFQPHNV